MASKRQLIEVDETTATRLRERADAQGISVAEVVASLTALSESPVEISAEDLADLDRQVAAIKSGEETTYPQDDVERWLATWGTPDYKPFPRNG